MDALRRRVRSPDGEFSLIASVIETSLNLTNAFGCLSRLSEICQEKNAVPVFSLLQRSV